MEVGVVRVADDGDFTRLKRLIDEHRGWRPDYDKGGVHVWTRPDPHHGGGGGGLNLVKVVANFPAVEPNTLYDVLHDPLYRPHWDTHMLCSEDIGYININNDVGYYAMSCPSPLKNRDFVLQRSWLDTGTEQMILNHSVFHKNYPPRKGYIRAISHMTGFVVRVRPGGGSMLGYVSQTDPQGRLPAWLVNTVTQSLAPKLARKLEKAALAYPNWKSSSENPRLMPWRRPDQIHSQRITIADCVDNGQKGSRETLPDEILLKDSKKKKSRRLSESD
ncbi:START domain-containing protein 10-like [Arctopsyche grandis]|uniref:START domain-containing protein 10-like n=1 Tax=Arctopsyche grandis TaxID=121162 RepID=UPI00406DA235